MTVFSLNKHLKAHFMIDSITWQGCVMAYSRVTQFQDTFAWFFELLMISVDFSHILWQLFFGVTSVVFYSKSKSILFSVF